MDAKQAQQQIDRALAAERAGQFDEAHELLQSVADRATGSLRFDALVRVARLGVQRGGEHVAAAEAALARTLAESSATPRQKAAAIHVATLLEHHRGRLDAAEELLCTSPATSAELTGTPEAAQYAHYCGLLAMDRRDTAKAESHFLEAHRLYTECGHTPGLAEVCDTISGLLISLGNTRVAHRFCLRSLEIKRSLGDRYGEAISLGTMGRLFALQARYDEAKQAFADDLQIARELDHDAGVGIMLNSLGDVALWQNDYHEAIQSFTASAQACPEPENLFHAYLGLARAHLATENLPHVEAAIVKLRAAIATLPPNPLLTDVANAVEGSVRWRRGDFAEGETRLRKAIAALHERRQTFSTIPFHYELRDCLQRQQRKAEATGVMAEALRLLSDCGSERGVRDVEQWLREVDQPALHRLVLERYFPDHVAKQLVAGDLSLPKSSRRRVTILFSDVRGYTTLTESMPADDVVELLNEWFTEATRVISRRGGIVDKFIGDAVMALFGVPEDHDEAAADAVRAALDMRVALDAMNRRNQALGRRELKIGIGVAMGDVVLGFIGSHLRQSYTAIGDAVNLASRLEGATKNYPGCDILITQEVESLQKRFNVAKTTSLGNAEIKGKSQPVAVYQVHGAINADIGH